LGQGNIAIENGLDPEPAVSSLEAATFMTGLRDDQVSLDR